MPIVPIEGLGRVEFTLDELEQWKARQVASDATYARQAQVALRQSASVPAPTIRKVAVVPQVAAAPSVKPRPSDLSDLEIKVLNVLDRLPMSPRHIARGLGGLPASGEVRATIATKFSKTNHYEISRSLKKLEDVAMEVGIADGELFRKTKEGREVRIFSGPMLAKLHLYIKA